MKISKILIAGIFVTGFLSIQATASFAADDAVGMCYEGTVTDQDTGEVTCSDGLDPLIVDDAANNACWVTEDGGNVCARGGMVPMPATLDEPVDGGCTVSTDAEGNSLEACYDAVPFTIGEDGEVIQPLDGQVDDSMLRDGEVDPTLMFQSGVAMPGSSSEIPASNLLAAFGVLVGALGAFGIGISRQKESK